MLTENSWNFVKCVSIMLKTENITKFVILMIIGNRTLCCPIRSVIIQAIDKIGRPCRMIKEQIGFHSVLITII